MKKIFVIVSFAFASFSLFSCEDVVNLEVQEGVSQLAVDALVTNKASMQTIKLTLSQAYFDNSPVKPALGATVIVYDQDSVAHEFIDIKNNGNYVYDASQKPLNKIGKQYALYIKYQGEEYVSLSKLNRVPKIDSINYKVERLPIKPDNGPQDGFQPQFYAKDFDGEGDCYWIKSAKNHKYFSKSTQISVSYDGGFSPGSKTDGLLFILPVRQSLGGELYSDKDTLTVDIYSITQEQFYYLQTVQQVSSNGGLFATPLSNLPTNIINYRSNSSKKAVGFFGISAVSSAQAIIDKTKAKPKD
ncbi:DUF4249 domain-containing protein [Emticicia sp. TH156]|uniref:DUF4249 domain-containing protein n=1 Tax=Emticicia sp. TH156 TaxID=2067454 RepID=UPI000C792ACD|nr:DUF4249 domain-containing protein [Emticicia sp. TH156]PLK46242.1 DUF4249 domain-containing protein [Emticicia sp. TH156]